MNPSPVLLNLDADAALVLFDLLSRYESNDLLPVEHHGETVALWKLEAALEKALDEPFHPAYREFVDAALGRLEGEEGA